MRLSLLQPMVYWEHTVVTKKHKVCLHKLTWFSYKHKPDIKRVNVVSEKRKPKTENQKLKTKNQKPEITAFPKIKKQNPET